MRISKGIGKPDELIEACRCILMHDRKQQAACWCFRPMRRHKRHLAQLLVLLDILWPDGVPAALHEDEQSSTISIPPSDEVD